MRQWRLHGWSILILLWAVTTWLVTFIVPDTPLRAVVVLGFLVFCPGMAVSRFLQLKDAAVELILGIALSITLDTIIACLLLYAGKWSPTIVLEFLIVLSVTGAIGQLIMGRMLSADIQLISANTLISGDIRGQQPTGETFILPITPIPGDIRDKDTVSMEQIARRNAALVDIEEKDTFETQQIYPRRVCDIAEINTSITQRIVPRETRTRSIPEMETVAMRSVRKHPVNARQPVPDIETIETPQIPKSIANTPRIPDIETIETPQMQRSPVHASHIPDMKTVAVKQIPKRTNRNIANKRDVEAIEMRSMLQHKAATPGITDIETIETPQIPL